MPREKNYEGHYTPPPSDAMGSDFGSRIDESEFGAIWDDVADVATSVWDDTAGKVMPDFMKEGIKKFADSAVGHVVLLAISGSAYYALAPTVGAQLAAVTFALPGMARGDNFMQAWTSGFVERVTLLIKYFVGQGMPDNKATEGVTDMAQGDMQKIQQYADSAGVGKAAAMTVQKLAQLLGVREDMAAEWLANATGDLSIPKQYNFDPKTGKILGKRPMTRQEKIDLVRAQVDPRYARTAQQKAIAIQNILVAQGPGAAKAQAAKKTVMTAGGAGMGVLGALALGASLPYVLGVGAIVGTLGYLLGKGK
jgi:hypothetical protein